MIDSYEREIKELEKNDQIKDKLMVISIYNEMFNHLRYSMSDYYRTYYENLMRDTFVKVIGNVQNASEFMVQFLELLKKDKLSQRVSDVQNNINYFLDDRNADIEGMDYVLTIDGFPLPFNVKAKILIILRNHINDVLGRLLKTFGESQAIKEVANDVITYLDVAVDSYLQSCMEYQIEPDYICNSLEDVLKMGTKVCLLNKYVDGEFSFELIASEDLRNYFLSFKDVEQAVLLANMAYGISGYSDNDCDVERIKEICNVLGISKAKFYLTLLSLTRKQVSLTKLEAKEKQKRKGQKQK